MHLKIGVGFNLKQFSLRKY